MEVLGQYLHGANVWNGLNRAKRLNDLNNLNGSAYASAAVERLERLGYALILNGLWQADTPIPTNDIWIAATAMEYGLSVVTTDDHYQKIPQIMVAYFTAV